MTVAAEPDHRNGGVRRFRPVMSSGLDLAVLILLIALALSVTPGLIGEDTKNDLYVDPWGFMGRALHLWDPQLSWGVVANQGYGYLFPMGPFFGIVGSILPMWVAQRLWWVLLLVAGYAGMRVLLRALGVGVGKSATAHRAAVLASLAYAVSPRVVSTVGGLSAETLPVVMAPWILAPLVLADRGRLSPRRAAAATGLAVLCCGGVNGAAVFFAVLPAAIWTVTRPRWWRSAVSWWSLLAVALATSWWIGPLIVLGRYAPPFMDWIENAGVVTDPIGLLDVARGTTHWLARLYTPGGPWWPAGFDIATSAPLVVATTALAAVGLLGLALPGLRHRRFLWLTLAVGVLILAVPHTGPLESPFAGTAQGLLDGPLAPLRNVHKADPLVRLPLTIAFAHALAWLAERAATRALWPARILWLTTTVLVVALAAPGLTRGINVRGAFEEMAPQWQQAGRWLDEHRTGGPALIVPAANFGEYFWGRTIDEPLRPLTSAPFAVRDSVPLTPAGTVRFLDEIEQRLQSGRSLGGAVDALRAAGTRYIVLRNGLDAYGAGQPPVAFARSALLATPGVTRAVGFGRSFQDASRERVQPVEIFDLAPATPMAQVWSADDVLAASGAPEVLPDLAAAGWGGPVVFDGDAIPELVPGRRVETDGYRARERFFGATRGRDTSASLTAAQDADVRDYRPWAGAGLRSVRVPDSDLTVSSSSSLADEQGLLGLWPAYSADAALDGDLGSAWATAFDPEPTLRLALVDPVDVRELSLTPLSDRAFFGSGQGVATRVEVRTERGSTVSGLTGTGPTRVAVPAGPTRWIEVAILDTDRGDPATLVTGLTEVVVPGTRTGSSIRLAEPGRGGASEGLLLSTGPTVSDGCVIGRLSPCLPGQSRVPEERALDRTLPATTVGTFGLSGLLTVDGRSAPASLTSNPGVAVRVSSTSTPAFRGGAFALADADSTTSWSPAASDREPRLELTFQTPTEIRGLTLDSPVPWPSRQPVYAVVSVDGETQRLAVPTSGRLLLAPATGRDVAITLTQPVGEEIARRGAVAVSELKVNDAALPQGPAVVDLACGQGPNLLVDGRSVPTTVELSRGFLAGEPAVWRACEDVELDGSGSQRIIITPPSGTIVATAALHRVGSTQATPLGVDVGGRWVEPNNIAVDLPRGDGDRVLVTNVNANEGWQLTVEGHDLRPVTIDGFKQAFVVPSGIHGPGLMEFAPDRPYRWALFGGGVGVLLLLVGSLWSLRSRDGRVRPVSGGRTGVPQWFGTVGILALGGAALGWSGLAVGAIVVVAGLVMRSRQGARDWRWAFLPAGLVLVAGLAQAVIAPAGLGPTWLEAVTRVLVLAGMSVAAVLGVDPADVRVSDDPAARSNA